MKKAAFLLPLLLLMTFTAIAQTELKLDGIQSMCISGKGPGQDGAINPYLGQKSIGVVENLGKNPLSIRIQNPTEDIQIIAVKPGETKEVDLLANDVLYLDSDAKSTAKVDFKEFRE